MCGIVAYIGGSEGASSKVLDGLKKLEYRGYDSWGTASLGSGNRIKIVKKIGKIGGIDTFKVAKLLGKDSFIALGHTRWATHGGISELNCHPHLDCGRKIAVVHNGIIENYQELKRQLKAKKHSFISQTDSEIIPHLIEERMKGGDDFVTAVRNSAKRLKGRSSFVAADSATGEVAAARIGAPLIVGVMPKDGGFYVSSDINAFLDDTNKVMYIDDGQVALLKASKHSPDFFEISDGSSVYKRVIEVDWSRSEASKAGYDHFLLKEIMEQKRTIAQAANQDDRKIKEIARKIRDAFGVFLVGSGTSSKVCDTASYLFSEIAEKHINSVIASEFSSYKHYLKRNSLVIAISQSGETADVLEAIDVAKERKAKVLSLLNAFGSTMMRVSDDFLMVNAGAERAVASTKATTAQLSLATLLAYTTAGRLTEGRILLLNTAAAVNDMLNPRYETHIKKLAKILVGKKDIFILGRGLNFPIAGEAAIKLQETCYIHAQGFAGGELKHGPLALIDKGTPCIVLAANDENRASILSNAVEVKARGGYIIGVSPEYNEVFDYWLKVPDTGNTSPIVNIIPIQMLAYHIAILSGINPDYPRNLAKSVTVK
jgi:glutamine---fructose-6-phosphate transaminase (isomerizing)